MANGRARMALIVALALVAGAFVEFRARAAAETRAHWQPGGTVFVAVREIDVGDVITDEHVIASASPAVLTPIAAITSVNGAIAARRIGVGEILTTSDVAGPTTGPREGRRWVAVPVDRVATPQLAPGDRVDLIGLDPFGTSATLIAGSVQVITPTEESVVVEVDTTEVSSIAESVAGGLILVVRAPG